MNDNEQNIQEEYEQETQVTEYSLVNFLKSENKIKFIINFLIYWKNKFLNLDKKKKIYITGTLILVVSIVWAFIAASMITKNYNTQEVSENADNQKVDARGIIITETKDGHKYFEIYGETGKYSNEENIAILNNVVGNFYKNGTVAMSFQSSKGSYNEETKAITLYENTYIVIQDDMSLSADRFVWNGSDKETIAEGNVKIKKSGEMYALADKCIISPEYEKFKIVGKTQTKIYGKEVSK